MDRRVPSGGFVGLEVVGQSEEDASDPVAEALFRGRVGFLSGSGRLEIEAVAELHEVGDSGGLDFPGHEGVLALDAAVEHAAHGRRVDGHHAGGVGRDGFAHLGGIVGDYDGVVPGTFYGKVEGGVPSGGLVGFEVRAEGEKDPSDLVGCGFGFASFKRGVRGGDPFAVFDLVPGSGDLAGLPGAFPLGAGRTDHLVFEDVRSFDAQYPPGQPLGEIRGEVENRLADVFGGRFVRNSGNIFGHPSLGHRGDGVDTDAVTFQFHRPDASQTVDSRLGGGVVALSEIAHESRDRTGVDDVTSVAQFDHGSGGFPADGPGPFEVDIDDRIPHRLFHLQKGLVA